MNKLKTMWAYSSAICYVISFSSFSHLWAAFIKYLINEINSLFDCKFKQIYLNIHKVNIIYTYNNIITV